MPYKISRDTFTSYDVNGKLNTLFDSMIDLYEVTCSTNRRLGQHLETQHEQCDLQRGSCDKCFAKVEDVRWLTWGFRLIAAAFIGGMITLFEIISKT